MVYSDETNMNIAKEEYKNREPGYILNTEDNEYLGTLSDAMIVVVKTENKFILILKQVVVMKLYLQMLRLVKEKRLRK